MNLEAGVREALDKVQALGKSDGNEHAIIVRDGKFAFERGGDAHSVDTRGIEWKGGDILVHNHPASLNSLSNVDVANLFHPTDDGGKLAAAYAIASDGSVFKAEHGAYGIWPEEFMMLSNEGIRTIFAESARKGVFADTDNMGGLGIGEAHWLNRMMHAIGVIRYSYELHPTTAKLVARLDDAIEFPQKFRV